MTEATTPRVAPPWQPAAFFTEEALRAAQEYWFTTHATNSRMIAEGRSAVGFMKGHIRRKLEREMGEDFKMYTGQTIGASSDGADSAGIRGELNQLLEQIYAKIAQGKPIQSPTQEDLTILTHPLGGLEACYAITFFYTTLMQRYATLAGNRRKVLKSILDEELFKWVWRMTIAFLMSEDPRKFDFSDSLLSTGIRQIPPDRQRATSAEKVLEIGNFLMGKSLSDSHLRFPLVFYFNTYCRHIQSTQLQRYSPQQCESIYNTIVSRKKEDGVSEVIVAIDEVMNTTGNSGQSFEDILKDEDAEVEKYIPPAEIDFIGQFREFTRGNIVPSLKRIMPKARANPAEGGASLMPLLLMLRTLPFYLRKNVLEKVPGPMLNMFVNRLQHGGDEVSSALATQARETMDVRAKSGETYSLVRQDVRKVGTQVVSQAPKSIRPPPGGVSAAPKASASSAPASSGAAPSPRPAAQASAAQAAPRPSAAAPAASAAASAGGSEHFDQPVIVSWRFDGGQIAVEAISARELVRLAGPEARILFQWVKFALQTGQVFRIPPDKVSKEAMENLITKLIKAAPADLAPALSKEERIALLEAGKGQTAKQLLAMLVKKLKRPAQPGNALQQTIAVLAQKLGPKLPAFLGNPTQDAFKPIVQGLSADERSAVSLLSRVARVS